MTGTSADNVAATTDGTSTDKKWGSLLDIHSHCTGCNIVSFSPGVITTVVLIPSRAHSLFDIVGEHVGDSPSASRASSSASRTPVPA